MEVEKRKIEIEKKDSEIIYSKAIKAGKRIYYLDVKKSRNEDLYLAITESKKKVTGFTMKMLRLRMKNTKYSFTKKISINLSKAWKMW